MELGVCIATKIDDIGHAVLAEQLGFSDVWVADSQMLWSDCYATMALIADRTERIRIGTGVAVAGTRSSAVTAAAHASINRIAPGRVFCAIGTGNTANRVMGAKPMPIAEFERYIGELRPLLSGEEAAVQFRGGTRLVRHIMPDAGFVAFEPRIPLYISGFGPRAMGLAVRHGDGLVMSIPPTAEGMERTSARMDAAAAEAGRTLDRSTFRTFTLTTIGVLAPGEAVDSDRMRAQCGPFAMSSLHYLFEQWKEAGRPDRHPPYDFWDDYVAMLDAVDPAVLHQRIHAGHDCWTIEEEERFVTRDLIAQTCLVGTAEDVATRLRELDEAGLGQVIVLPSLADRDTVLREIATQVMPLL